MRMKLNVAGETYRAMAMDGAWFLFDEDHLVYEVLGNKVYCHVQDTPIRCEGEEANGVLAAVAAVKEKGGRCSISMLQ